MPWTYKQSTGEMLKPDGTRLAFGFAGNTGGLNNPLAQDQRNIGPLPQAKYTMTSWLESDPHLGLCVIVLDPMPLSKMFDRAGFRIHGARSVDKNGIGGFLASSDGCVCIASCYERRIMWQSKDHVLEVVP